MKQVGEMRRDYFTGVGVDVRECKSVAEVLETSGLNYTVSKQPIFLDGSPMPIENRFATVRSDNNQVLGIVKKNYTVVDNAEGFEFINDILGEGVTFTKAGTYNRGERACIIAEAPEVDILGDKIRPSMLFTNSHDGGSSLGITFVPGRVACANGLVIPVAGHEKGVYRFSIQHSKSVKDRLMAAKDTLARNSIYIEALREQAERLAETKFTYEQYDAMVKELAGIQEDAKPTRGQLEMVKDLAVAYNEDDVLKFDGTAWRAILAVSDYDTHRENSRNTGNNEYQFERVVYGMSVLAAAYQIVARMTGFRR